MQWTAQLKWLALGIGLWVGLGDPVEGQAQWIDSLSPAIQSCILWSADHEEGNLRDWHFDDQDNAGGGVFNTGGLGETEAIASSVVAHSGQFAAKTTIANAIRAENGPRAVRLLRWTDTAWTAGGRNFPAEAYYSVWMYFPRTYNPNKQAPWDPGDGGWWNVFQFKANDASGESRSMWTLNVELDEGLGNMQFYLSGAAQSYAQENPKPVPAQQWVHVEVFYRYTSLPTGGAIVVWQDGELILNVQGVQTAHVPEEGPIWGVGNYTDHIAGDVREGTATIFFDDAIVGRRRALSADIVQACSSQTTADTLPPVLP